MEGMQQRSGYEIGPTYAAQEQDALLVVSRRDFMRNGLIAVVTVISAGVAIPDVRYFIDPALEKPQTEWVGIASAADIPVGTPTRVEYLQRTRDGWRGVTGRYATWVVTKDGQEFVAFGPKCTHLGCAYHWEEKRQQFLCPCHTGIFDIDGNVVSGPPPRPLDRYEVRIREGQIEIGRLLKG
jgi:menaquinol-cytochrome c reductase iron-sulfur subunit